MNGNKLSSTSSSNSIIEIDEGAKLNIVSSGDIKGVLEKLNCNVIVNKGEFTIDNVILKYPVLMTVSEFLTAIGTEVETITYDTTQNPGVALSTNGKTANVNNVILSGVFSNTDKFF